ncbi:MAG TPA: TIGR03618 family F420-dependent PPOX class oxidoreductase [Actinomycetota bacterium]|nr:TIGR03618 family F420-dependent PPOX class oxidoreductase [Actinomycetota bacterium]
MGATDLDFVRALAEANGHRAVVSTSRADGSIQATLVSAGVMPHPVTGRDVVALVAYPGVKVRNVRARPRATVTFVEGGRWVSVEGAADLAGPDDALEGLDPSAVPQLLRDVFTAAGGTHDDWDEYDRVMAQEGRVAVLIAPDRLYTN